MIEDKEIQFNIPKDTGDERKLLIDLKNNVGAIIRSEKGFFIVKKYIESKVESKKKNELIFHKDVFNELAQLEKEYNQVMEDLEWSKNGCYGQDDWNRKYEIMLRIAKLNKLI